MIKGYIGHTLSDIEKTRIKNALTAYGCTKFIDTILDIEDKDTLVIFALDKISLKLQELFSTLKTLAEKNITLISIYDGINTSIDDSILVSSKYVLNFIKRVNSEKAKRSLKARKNILDEAMVAKVEDILRTNPKMSQAQACRHVGINPKTYSSYKIRQQNKNSA